MLKTNAQFMNIKIINDITGDFQIIDVTPTSTINDIIKLSNIDTSTQMLFIDGEILTEKYDINKQLHDTSIVSDTTLRVVLKQLNTLKITITKDGDDGDDDVIHLECNVNPKNLLPDIKKCITKHIDEKHPFGMIQFIHDINTLNSEDCMTDSEDFILIPSDYIMELKQIFTENSDEQEIEDYYRKMDDSEESEDEDKCEEELQEKYKLFKAVYWHNEDDSADSDDSNKEEKCCVDYLIGSYFNMHTIMRKTTNVQFVYADIPSNLIKSTWNDTIIEQYREASRVKVKIGKQFDLEFYKISRSL